MQYQELFVLLPNKVRLGLFERAKPLNSNFWEKTSCGHQSFLMHLYNLVLFINHQQPFNYGNTKPKRRTFHQRLGLQI